MSHWIICTVTIILKPIHNKPCRDTDFYGQYHTPLPNNYLNQHTLKDKVYKQSNVYNHWRYTLYTNNLHPQYCIHNKFKYTLCTYIKYTQYIYYTHSDKIYSAINFLGKTYIIDSELNTIPIYFIR